MDSSLQHQQQQVNSSFECQTVASKPEQLICTTEAATPKETIKLDPVSLTTTLHELTLLVVALTQMSKLFLPLIRKKKDKKIKSKVCIKSHTKS